MEIDDPKCRVSRKGGRREPGGYRGTIPGRIPEGSCREFRKGHAENSGRTVQLREPRKREDAKESRFLGIYYEKVI